MWALNLSAYFYMYISKMCLITNALSNLPNWWRLWQLQCYILLI